MGSQRTRPERLGGVRTAEASTVFPLSQDSQGRPAVGGLRPDTLCPTTLTSKMLPADEFLSVRARTPGYGKKPAVLFKLSQSLLQSPPNLRIPRTNDGKCPTFPLFLRRNAYTPKQGHLWAMGNIPEPCEQDKEKRQGVRSKMAKPPARTSSLAVLCESIRTDMVIRLGFYHAAHRCKGLHSRCSEVSTALRCCEVASECTRCLLPCFSVQWAAAIQGAEVESARSESGPGRMRRAMSATSA